MADQSPGHGDYMKTVDIFIFIIKYSIKTFQCHETSSYNALLLKYFIDEQILYLLQTQISNYGTCILGCFGTFRKKFL